MKNNYSKRAYKERKNHCALCGELRLSIEIDEIIGKSYKELSNLVDEYNTKYGLDIIISGGGYGFEVSSYNVAAVKLFKEELKKIDIVKKYYIVSFVEGLDWYANVIWFRNEVLRGSVCSAINRGVFDKIKNKDLFMVKDTKQDLQENAEIRIQESKFRNRRAKEITEKVQLRLNKGKI